MHQDDRQLVRGAEIRVGGMRGELLVPEGHEIDPHLGERVDQRQVRVAALAEDLRDALLPEALRDELRAGHPWASSANATRPSLGRRAAPPVGPSGRWLPAAVASIASIVNPLVSYVRVSAGVK
jgi:hypothetical protein